MLAARANQSRRPSLNLGFTHIRAPFKGRAGEAKVKPGNLVAPNETLLTTVVSVDPVYVTFTGDERAYLRYQELARTGGARKLARHAQSRCSSASPTRKASRTRARWISSTTH